MLPLRALIRLQVVSEGRRKAMAEENVVLVTFEEESKAYQAASVLAQGDAEGCITLHAVAIVQRFYGAAGSRSLWAALSCWFSSSGRSLPPATPITSPAPSCSGPSWCRSLLSATSMSGCPTGMFRCDPW